MANYKITLLKGDGIGPEIVNQAVKVLDKAAEKFDFTVEYDEALLGGCAIDATGVPLPEETVAKCKASDSVILGAVGGPKWDNQPGNNRPEAGLLGIRGALGLFANLRPSVIFGPLKSASPIKDEIIGDNMDIMIVRELTGGIYFGERGRDDDSAWDTEKYSVAEVERIARVAFDMAMKRNKKLTSVDKANVLESSRLWRQTVINVSKDYPEVELNHSHLKYFWRHSLRRGFNDCRFNWNARVSQPFGRQARSVRAYPRFSSRYRGQGYRQSSRDNPFCGNDAPILSRTARGGGSNRSGCSKGSRDRPHSRYL